MRLEDILTEALAELKRAESIYPPLHSRWEGYAVIKEELDELWDKIKSKDATRPEIKEEAVQVAAMAIRFLKDLVPE